MIHNIELLQVINRTHYIGRFVQKGMSIASFNVILPHIKKPEHLHFSSLHPNRKT
ncbi:hypothetical protein SAMN05518856_109318 [Paenibacillus sp. OK003]|nr:hypothetical protein SAMN05518856_109318 [Paenibacillus sp. OK003]